MPSDPPDKQAALFDLPPLELEAAAPAPEHVRLAAELPPSITLGAMTWSYPGWIGIVYAAGVQEKLLSGHGLTAYAKHPLLRMVEIDRSYYDPIPATAYRAYADQVPDGFRLFAKAHEECTVLQFPAHPRYGKKRGEHNPRFLDAAYASDAVVGPFAEGLGAKKGGLLFQFPPQDVGDPYGFAHRLHEFLRRLPKGVPYAVEIRNKELLTSDYGAALEDTGVIHCHNQWTSMPSVLFQVKRIPPGARRPLLVRWLLREGDRYEDASARCKPFNRIVAEDRETRTTIAELAAKAHRHGVPVFVLVDNKAEGCAPESIFRLARAIRDALEQANPRAER